MTLATMGAARRASFNWAKSCRQLFVGYGPCFLPKNHDGLCASVDSVMVTFENKTRIVAVTRDGKLKRTERWEYILEKPRKAAALAEAKRLLVHLEEELATLRNRKAELVRVVKAGGKCDRIP